MSTSGAKRKYEQLWGSWADKEQYVPEEIHLGVIEPPDGKTGWRDVFGTDLPVGVQQGGSSGEKPVLKRRRVVASGKGKENHGEGGE